jgi:hypothetical protein
MIESSSRIGCINCGESLSPETRRCPHCGELQPTPLIDGGIAVGGVFLALVSIPLGAFTEGLIAIAGYGGAFIGVAMILGAVTRYIDIQSDRKRD